MTQRELRADREEFWRQQGVGFWLFYGGLASAFWLFMFWSSTCACLLLPVSALTITAGVMMGRRGPRSLRIEREVLRRLASVPEDLQRRAMRFYGKDEYPWECAAIECFEAHLPGDCPLCGAT